MCVGGAFFLGGTEVALKNTEKGTRRKAKLKLETRNIQGLKIVLEKKLQIKNRILKIDNPTFLL